MGEYAEKLLDGTCCESCGEYMGGGEGFPRYCSPECAPDSGAEIIGAKPFRCDQCGKNSRTAAGIEAHKKAKHAADFD